MMRFQPPVHAIAICLFIGTAVSGQVLWKAPPRMTVADWQWGPGGAAGSPQPPFRFLKENLNGTNPKINVRDVAGKEWVVKFGSEVHADTFAARLSYALGYAAAPTHFVAGGVIEDVSGLKRAKPFVDKDGAFRAARFKLRVSHKANWSWVENPFLESRELGGLKILTMLLSNWVTKDARDGEGSNTGIFKRSQPDGTPNWFAVTDWGASLGKSGGFFERDRWNWRGYRDQTPQFVTLLPGGTLRWGFRGKHGTDITAGVGIEDIRWLLPYLGIITDEELVAGLTASGASLPVAEHFAKSIRDRIRQLQRIAEEQ
jgi:hypothetical protein